MDDSELEMASEDEKNPKNAVISLYLRAMAAQQAQEEAEEMLQQKALTNECPRPARCCWGQADQSAGFSAPGAAGCGDWTGATL